MNTYIALFRGINVGGKNILPMKELRSLLEKLGCTDVRTYIQSGNVVLDSKESNRAALTTAIRRAVHNARGFEPHVFLLDRQALVSAVEANPFREAESEPKSLHLFFLESSPGKLDWSKLEKWRVDNEQFELVGLVFYLHAPDGIGRSKLAARMGGTVAVPMTARNWRTVTKLLELAGEG